MKVVITEKPSVAKEIAKNFNASNIRDGYIEGNGVCYTWAYGHLLTLADPESYGYVSWRAETLDKLPFMPEKFLLQMPSKDGKKGTVDEGIKKQLGVIKKLFDACDEIIVATDAGREGELIFRYIYEYLDCKKPFKRLWISSQTNQAIREGFENLKPGRDYDNLYYAGLTRSQSDWLVGINATQALSLSANSRNVLSLGRVQTPTLALICKRYLDNTDFKPTAFYKIYIDLEKDNLKFRASSKNSYPDKVSAQQILSAVNPPASVAVSKCEMVTKNEKPPLLYDLTLLQQSANKKFGFSANETLQIAQSLYEAKMITYPRTGSNYIGEDVFKEIPSLIKGFTDFSKVSPHLNHVASLLSENSASLNKNSVNDAKVTDHHALLPTDPHQNYTTAISEKQNKIYSLIAVRLLEAFHQVCIKDVQTLEFINDSAPDVAFTVSGSVIKQHGWRSVSINEVEESEEIGSEQEFSLPVLVREEVLAVQNSVLKELFTKPKAVYTEATLLDAMKNCGREVQEQELKDGLKEIGIGTPATRASVIETLFKRNYIIREKNKLIPTEIGLAVFDIVKDKSISQVEMTGRWENKLEQVATGAVSHDDFIKNIKSYTLVMTKELIGAGRSIAGSAALDPNAGLNACPKCQTGKIRLFEKSAACTNKEPKCDFIIWRTMAAKKLTDGQLNDITVKKISGLVKGFVKKDGTTFDAHVKLNPDFTVGFDFPQKKKPSKGKFKI